MSTKAEGNRAFQVGATFATYDAFRVALDNYQAKTFSVFVEQNLRSGRTGPSKKNLTIYTVV